MEINEVSHKGRKRGEKAKGNISICFFGEKGTGRVLTLVHICRHMQIRPSLKAFHSHIFVSRAFFKGKTL
jgi:hypothetical protein